jgi:hypothetical protein
LRLREIDFLSWKCQDLALEANVLSHKEKYPKILELNTGSDINANQESTRTFTKLAPIVVAGLKTEFGVPKNKEIKALDRRLTPLILYVTIFTIVT